MGFNENSARLVGIPVDKVRMLVYGLCGLLAGGAGFIPLPGWAAAGPMPA